MSTRPEVPAALLRRLAGILEQFPRCRAHRAWVGTSWRVGSATVAHVFGGEDQLFRLTFRADPSELGAFENLGHPYFRPEWGTQTVGMIVDEHTDWVEVRELLTDSYCLQAPPELAASVPRPEHR